MPIWHLPVRSEVASLMSKKRIKKDVFRYLEAPAE